MQMIIKSSRALAMTNPASRKPLPTKPLWRWVGLGLLLSLLIITSCTATQVHNYESVQLLLGSPSGTPDSTNKDDYLIIKPQYALSYNNSKGTANWVSWQLNASWLGKVERCRSFSPDPNLPSGFKVVLPSDYTNSGFSRGHLTRSRDRSATSTDNCATFLMTNIVPQTQDNNEGPWLELENLAKDLAESGKELYIIAGPWGEGATGLKGIKTKIGKNRISVPSTLWKIVVILDKPGLGINGIKTDTRIIAVNIPNQLGIKTNSYKNYLITVKELEKLTGYNFLSNVPKHVQDVIEARKMGKNNLIINSKNKTLKL